MFHVYTPFSLGNAVQDQEADFPSSCSKYTAQRFQTQVTLLLRLCLLHNGVLFVKLWELCDFGRGATVAHGLTPISHLLCWRILKLKYLFQGRCREGGHSETFLNALAGGR